MKSILIIGSRGFIGSHALERFSIEPGWSCWEADISGNTRSGFFRIDPTVPDFESIFKSGQFDVCINCSGAANVSESLQKPAEDFRLNSINVLGMLEAIRKFSPKTFFLNLSSAAVYGNPKHLPVKETTDVQPVSPYGYHKYLSELLCEEYSSVYGIRACSVRIFSAYGPGLRKQILWDLYQKSLKGPDIVLSGTGRETRDFVHIDDIIDALLLIVSQSTLKWGIYNLGSGKSTTIEQLSNLLVKGLDSGCRVVFDNRARIGDPLHWQADIGRLSSIGFRPSVTIENGVLQCAYWLREQALQ